MERECSLGYTCSHTQFGLEATHVPWTHLKLSLRPKRWFLEQTWTFAWVSLLTCFWPKCGHFCKFQALTGTLDIYLVDIILIKSSNCSLLSLLGKLKSFAIWFLGICIKQAFLHELAPKLDLKYLWRVSLEHWGPLIVSLLANFLVLHSLLWRDLEITIFWTFLTIEGLPLLFSSWGDFRDNLFFHQPFTGLKIIFIASAT